MHEDICPICNKICTDEQNSVECSTCHRWVHHKNRKNCTGLTNREFKMHHEDSSKFWECDRCYTKSFTTLPCSHLDEDNWLHFNGLNTKLTSKKVNILSSENKEFAAQCESIQNMLNSANDDEDLLTNHINSKYYYDKQFNKVKFDTASSFGMFHANIASLNKHIDDLKLILSRLSYKFDIIGISEHKIHKGTLPSNNISIPGYGEFIFEPTETTHGGTGFYIKDNVDYFTRSDLQINSAGDFESMFIEVKFSKRKNLIVGCIYRHPNSDIPVTDFTNLYLDPILQKSSSEKKQCVLMGDFNVDLL